MGEGHGCTLAPIGAQMSGDLRQEIQCLPARNPVGEAWRVALAVGALPGDTSRSHFFTDELQQGTIVVADGDDDAPPFAAMLGR